MQHITVHAIDRDSSDTFSRTFRADIQENVLRLLIKEFMKEIPFTRFYVEAHNLDGLTQEQIDLIDSIGISTENL